MTPNDKSGGLQRYAMPACTRCMWESPMKHEIGKWVDGDDALSAIEAAREQGWREGREAAAREIVKQTDTCEASFDCDRCDELRKIRDAVLALAPPAAPQGEEPKEVQP